MNKVAVKNAAGTMVGMLKLDENCPATGALDELQHQIDRDMRGNGAWSLFVDHDRAKRALERAVAAAGDGGRLFVSWATAEEIRAFELLPRRVN